MKIKSPAQSAFFYPRVLVGVVLCFASVALAFFALHNASAQANPPLEVKGEFRGLAPVVKFDVSPALRDMQVIPPGPGKDRENEDREIMPFKVRFAPEWDPVVQSTVGIGGPDGMEIPAPIVTFNAQPNTSGVSPPDPNGAVGPNHVVTMGNLSFQIFNKTGTSLFGPAANNTLWAGFGGACQAQNAGDPVVLYDRLSNRWFLSQFTSAAPFFFCVAISQTPDPTGAYFRYAISTGSNFPDYPKAGVWPDAYYVSTREFAGGSGGPFAGVGAYALNRAQAVAGDPSAQIISFLAPPTPAYILGDGLLPSDLDGTTLPPAGSPNFFVGSMDNNGPYGAPQDALTLWKFTANFSTPPASSFVLANTIPVASFNSILGICGGSRACIPQPGTTNRIDHLGYRQRPLFRLAYRNFGDHESLVTNQSVSGGTGPNGEVSGIRWWELRSPNSSPVVFQEGTYAPGVTDGIHRWMGSIAMDGAGNMALGFSTANDINPSVFPSVSYTGRLAGSPLGTMPLGEANIITGTGSQTAGGNRWGDYTSLTIDPSDDLTFWHVNEWVPTTSGTGWQLRVGSFKVVSVPTNILSNGSASVVSAGANGVLDPGEVVSVSLGVRNTGGPGVICTTAATIGTLLATGGVTNPSAPQNYGPLCSGSPSTFHNFTFTVDPALPCGTSTVTTSLVVTDGATNYGTFTNTFSVGVSSSSGVQNFDGVVQPALPAGWTTTFSGSGTPVVTEPINADTPPNDIFLSEAPSVGLSEVTSAPIAITSAGTRLSFRNLFNTQTGFDGLVLEISIAGGPFQDIVAAGGTFASGGYNTTLPTTFSNPLGGRMAWTGLSGGTQAAPTYITTIVNLPAAATGQNIQLKWRQGSDSATTPSVNAGSRIDTITLNRLICGGNAPVPTSVVSRKLHNGTPFDIALPLSGPSGVECRRGTGANLNNHQFVLTFNGQTTAGGVSVTSSDGLATATRSASGNTITVNVSAVADAQILAVTLSNVADGSGNLGNINLPVGILLGDVNASRSIKSEDALITRGRSGQATDGKNFSSDVNEDGFVNGGDTTIVRSRSGNMLPESGK